jgi:hypothetical protein
MIENGKSVKTTLSYCLVTVALSPLAQSTHTAQPKFNKAASKPTRPPINTGKKLKRANSARLPRTCEVSQGSKIQLQVVKKGYPRE